MKLHIIVGDVLKSELPFSMCFIESASSTAAVPDLLTFRVQAAAAAVLKPVSLFRKKAFRPLRSINYTTIIVSCRVRRDISNAVWIFTLRLLLLKIRRGGAFGPPPIRTCNSPDSIRAPVNPKTHISELWPDLHLTCCPLIKKYFNMHWNLLVRLSIAASPALPRLLVRELSRDSICPQRGVFGWIPQQSRVN